MISVGEIAERLNALAPSLAPELLPNGFRQGNKWMASGIADTGQSASLYVRLAGERVGHWRDMGSAAAGEERGDMLDLLRLRRGLADAAAAVVEAKAILGIEDRWDKGRRSSPEEQAEAAARADEARERHRLRVDAAQAETMLKVKRAMGLYLSAAPLAGSPAEHYLLGRGLARDPIAGDPMEWPGALRYHPEVYHFVEKAKFGALVAAIYNADGAQIGVQRIFLEKRRGRWEKLQTPNPKMVLGTVWGGFVPINKGWSGKSMRSMPDGEAVYVTEGIEDALALRMLRPSARIIAAVNLPNIGALVLPEAAKKLVVVADRDPSERAQAQLERSIAQAQAKGLEVGLVMPPEGCKDLNEWLLAWIAEEQGRGDRSG